MLIAIALLAFGVVMVTSAGMSLSSGDSIGGDWSPFVRPAGMAALAIALLVVGSIVPVSRLCIGAGRTWSMIWIAVVVVILLVAVRIPGIGREVNGAWRWIQIGPLGFQPSEVAKWAMPLVLAAWTARHLRDMQRFRTGFLLPMGFVFVICALIATEDLGTAVLIGAVSLVMLLAAGTRMLHLATLVPFAAGGFALALILSPYRIDRLRAFVNPYDDPQGIGYHIIQSMAAVSGGGLAGRGLGNGLRKFGYLPEDTTDFLFSIIAEELGVAGVLLVGFLFTSLLVLGFSIVRHARDSFSRLLALGIVTTIGLQALINLLVVTGLAPTKGIALPLLSWGGTGWCLTAFSIGLLSSIDRAASQPRAIESVPDSLAVST